MVWWIFKVMMMTNGAKPTLEKNEVFSSEITIENDYYKNMGFVSHFSIGHIFSFHVHPCVL
jgi:hypothetical protein